MKGFASFMMLVICTFIQKALGSVLPNSVVSSESKQVAKSNQTQVSVHAYGAGENLDLRNDAHGDYDVTVTLPLETSKTSTAKSTTSIYLPGHSFNKHRLPFINHEFIVNVRPTQCPDTDEPVFRSDTDNRCYALSEITAPNGWTWHIVWIVTLTTASVILALVVVAIWWAKKKAAMAAAAG